MAIAPGSSQKRSVQNSVTDKIGFAVMRFSAMVVIGQHNKSVTQKKSHGELDHRI